MKRTRSGQEKEWWTSSGLGSEHSPGGWEGVSIVCWEGLPWKQVCWGPTELQLELETWWTEGQRGKGPVFLIYFFGRLSVQHLLVQVWIRCGRFIKAKWWRLWILSMRRTLLRRYTDNTFFFQSSMKLIVKCGKSVFLGTKLRYFCKLFQCSYFRPTLFFFLEIVFLHILSILICQIIDCKVFQRSHDWRFSSEVQKRPFLYFMSLIFLLPSLSFREQACHESLLGSSLCSWG